jgi:hypothetical protein
MPPSAKSKEQRNPEEFIISNHKEALLIIEIPLGDLNKLPWK